MRVLEFGPHGDLLVTGGSGESLSFWSLPELRAIRRVEIGGLRSWGAGVRGDKLLVATETSNQTRERMVRALRLPDGEPKLLGKASWGEFLDVDATGTWEAFGRLRTLGLRSLDGTHRERILGEHRGEVQAATFSPEGDSVASLDESGEIRIWSLAEGAGLPRVLQGPKPRVPLLLLDPEGRRVVTPGLNNSIHLWDLDDPPDAQPAVLGGAGPATGWVSGAFDPGGHWLATTYSQAIEFWPFSSPRARVLPGFALANGSRVAFTSDSRWLVTCNVNEPMRLWPWNPA
jgi:WD40 repeat protein